MGNTNNFGSNLYYPLWISMSFLIYWISYASATNYSLMIEQKEIRKETINNGISKTKTHLSDVNNIFSKFEIIAQENFMNPLLSIDILARKLNISSNYLSQLISQKDLKFNSYINSLRIENAKKMLTDEIFSSYTITSIGLEAGFNSKASFYRAFKKHTGMSPSEFRNNKN